MDKNMNKDDFMNDLYDYLWVPEEEQGTLYLHQNILFGRAADEEKIACATLPYLFRLGITPQMRGYEILCRAVILYLLDGIQDSTHLTLLMTIAVERGTSLTSVERACAAAIRYAWNEGYMSADDENSDAITFREMPTVTQFIDRLAETVRSKIGDEIKLYTGRTSGIAAKTVLYQQKKSIRCSRRGPISRHRFNFAAAFRQLLFMQKS